MFIFTCERFVETKGVRVQRAFAGEFQSCSALFIRLLCIHSSELFRSQYTGGCLLFECMLKCESFSNMTQLTHSTTVYLCSYRGRLNIETNSLPPPPLSLSLSFSLCLSLSLPLYLSPHPLPPSPSPSLSQLCFGSGNDSEIFKTNICHFLFSFVLNRTVMGTMQSRRRIHLILSKSKV